MTLKHHRLCHSFSPLPEASDWAYKCCMHGECLLSFHRIALGQASRSHDFRSRCCASKALSLTRAAYRSRLNVHKRFLAAMRRKKIYCDDQFFGQRKRFAQFNLFLGYSVIHQQSHSFILQGLGELHSHAINDRLDRTFLGACKL